MNFKAVKHHSAFLRDKISFLELSSHSVTSWAENWLWQGEYCHVSLFMISMVILVMVIFIMRMMLTLITVILMELMTSCVENWLWLHCQPLHGLHNGQDWHRQLQFRCNRLLTQNLLSFHYKWSLGQIISSLCNMHNVHALWV